MERLAGEFLPHAAEHFQGPARPDFELDSPETRLEGGPNRRDERIRKLHSIQARANLDGLPRPAPLSFWERGRG